MNINKALVILSLCLLLLSLVSTSTVYAQVSIKTTCYNSNSIVTEDLRTENADYYGITVLAPTSISSNGAGESVDDEFSEFYHRVFAANEGDSGSIAAYLKTESGGYEWVNELTASSEGLSMGMSVDCEIENGNLEASYRNSLSSHIEELMTNDANYSVSTIITPSAITSDGIGSSLLKESKSEDNDTEKEKNENSGFYHMIYVEGNGKWTEIRTNLTCESIDFDWKKSANTFRLNSSMSMVLAGESKNGSIEVLEMDGDASNFPAQHLPPGQFSTSSPIYDDVEEYYDEFSQYPVALFYSIEQECFIPPGEGHHPLVYDIGDGEYFQLGMGFLFGQNESGEG
ncbi:MAG: hypothetical protein WBB08_08250 [Halobacteriota archaeon]